MTANQIAYWKLQEEKRSNLAKELEQNRSNVEKERETHRSNTVQEAHARSVLGETTRSNKAREDETKRHNIVSEVMSGINTVVGSGTEIAKKFISLPKGG